jgi:aminopeptidase C
MKKLLISLLILLCAGTFAMAQYKYEFTNVKVNPATPVKNQASTGTCWCFATNSFIESELLRMGKGEYDLSEMYIVRMNYVQRIWDNYLRAGKGNIGPGSIAHMYIKRMSESGLLPDEVYDGLNYGSKSHNHQELSQWIKSASEISIKNRRPLQPEILNGILDAYLGKVPAKFTYKGKEYTPMSFYKSLGLNAGDYVELTSVAHHPFYERVPLEITDNWDHELLYNVPIDDLIKIMDNAIEKGYTIAWDGDVSEKSFAHGNHIALNTDVSLKGTIKERIVENPVTQESRQAGIENFSSTDDHLMHVTGLCKDQNGTKYYITKNSWGISNGDGYLNMSENYVRAKCISILVNKNSIPKEIRTKLNIK